MTTTEDTGRAGEYLVAYRLEVAGVRTVHVNLAGHDLWCHTPSGRLISVQVKASATPSVQDDRTYYIFYNRNSIWQANVFAFADIDTGLVIFEPTMSKRRKIQVDAFTPELMRSSIARFFY
jgi:hypothetical protein